MASLDYDGVDWSKYFYCDPESKSGLRWNMVSYSAYGKKLERWIGKDAGSLGSVKNGDNKAWSVKVTINGVNSTYKVHRIIAVMNGLSVNGQVIDHKNGTSADNNLKNIRVTDLKLNARNRKVQHDSPYGINGVGFQQDKVGNCYFTARWAENGKRVQKSFPILTLGVMEAFKQAVVARGFAIKVLNQKYDAGYTSRHSREIDKDVINLSEYSRDMEAYAKTFRKQTLRVDNTSGIVGVGFSRDKKSGATSAVASWKPLNGKSKNKKFSVKKLGLLPAFKAAVEHRRKMIEELNAQGAGYTENHGK